MQRAGYHEMTIDGRIRARFHAEPPVVLACASTDLLPRGLVQGPLRIVHVDGSYEPSIIRQDIATALAMVHCTDMAVTTAPVMTRAGIGQRNR